MQVHKTNLDLNSKEFFKKSLEKCSNQKRIFKKENFGKQRGTAPYVEYGKDTIIFVDNYENRYNLNLSFRCQKLVLSIFDKKEKHFFHLIYGNKLSDEEKKFCLAFL